MKATISSFICISLLITNFSLETAYKAAKIIAKTTAAGVGIITTGVTADLLRNYTKYPNVTSAKEATIKDLDDAQRAIIMACLDEQKAYSFWQQALDTAAPFLVDYAEHYAATKSTLIKETDKTITNILKHTAIKTPTTIAHLQIYPKQEDCPCVERFDACDAHKVHFAAALLIKAEKLGAKKPEFK